MGNWDLKRKIFDNNFLKYHINHSLPNIFNLSSIYMLNPLFDSGMGIYSNRDPIFSGFEKWNISSTYGRMKYTIYNKGVSWYFYESDNKKNGICVLNISIVDDVPEWIIISQLKQIIEIKNFLMEKYSSNYEKYESIIIGDFKLEFNLKDIITEIYLKWKILEEGNLKILGKSGISSTDFILYEEKHSKSNSNLNIIKSDYIKSENDTLFSIEIKCNKDKINKFSKFNLEPNTDFIENTNNYRAIVNDVVKDVVNKVFTEGFNKVINKVEKNEDQQIIAEKEEKNKEVENEEVIENTKIIVKNDEIKLKEIIIIEDEKEIYKPSLIDFKIDIEKSKEFENPLYENIIFRDLDGIEKLSISKDKYININDNYFIDTFEVENSSSDDEWHKI